jgi:YtkA-like
MDQQIGTHWAARLGALSLSLVAGLSSCSSANQTTPTSTQSAIALADAAIGCAKDPRGEAFTPELTHEGDSGNLSFVIAGANYSPPAVTDNTWTLKVLSASGEPVKDAVLTFPKQSHPSDPWMPDHGHGDVPARAVNNNDGTYTITPLYFFMGGIWSTYISAQSGSVTDSTTFTFCVGS